MRISEREVTRLACCVIARVPVRSPFSLFSHGESNMDKSEEHLRLIQLTKQNSNQRNDGGESKNSSHISGVVGSRSQNVRSRWNEEKRDLKVGDVVLAVSSDLPRAHWPLGRITKIYQGKDNHVRVASWAELTLTSHKKLIHLDLV